MPTLPPACPRFSFFHPRFRVLLPPALLGLVAAAGMAATPAPVLAPAPDWIVTQDWSAPKKPKENASGEDFLLLDVQARAATSETYRHNVYQIVTDNGRQNSSQVYFYFDPSYETLILHHIRLVRGAEVFDKLDAGKIQVIQQERDLDRQLYDGQRSALLILDDVRIGDIIDLAYTLRGANPVFAGRYIDTLSLEWGVPVRKLHYRLLVPEGRNVATKAIGPATLAPEIRTRDGEQEYIWRRANLPIVESEDHTPSSHVVFSFLDLSEFNGWSDVVRWAGPLYALDPGPQPLLDAVVAGIRSRAQTPEQQAVAALTFVQQEIRYLGIEMGPGSHRPSEPAVVLERRFGDCKDKSRLLTALLQRLDLEAAPALVNSSHRETVHLRLPSPFAFDHVIVALDLDRRRYLLDPTLAYQAGDQLNQRHIGRYGPYLRIAEGNAGLGDSQLGPRDLNHIAIREEFQLTGLEQPAAFTVTTVSQGRAAESQRAFFATRTIDQISREYLDYYTTYYPSITMLRPVEHADNRQENIYTTTEHYQIKRLFNPEAGSTILRAEIQPGTVREYTRHPNLTQRRQPLALNHPIHIEESITLTLPEDWPVTPLSETVEDEAFTLKARVSQVSARQLALHYSWDSKAHQVDPARLAVFSANAEKARQSLGFELTWNTAPAATPVPDNPTGAYPLNWPMAGLTVAVLCTGGYVSWRLARKKNPAPPGPPPGADPAKPVDPYSYQGRKETGLEGLGGWLILVAFGLCVRPFVLVYHIQDSHQAYFNARIWQRLTTPASEVYNPHFALVAPLELLFNLTLLVYSLLLLVLFFRRSYLFPRTIQVFFGVAIAAAFFSIWDTAMLSPNDPAFNLENGKALFQALVGAAIWIPYFQVSRRVKNTFVL